MRKKYTMIVRDRIGVLNRITGFIRRNGWNVVSVHVEPIAGSDQSTMSLTIDFTEREASRFEQRLREWNFIFDIRDIQRREG